MVATWLPCPRPCVAPCNFHLIAPDLTPDGQVPLEIAFEDDMVISMCSAGEVSFVADRQTRSACAPWQIWFWCNFFVDLWFIIDIFVNLRTGYVIDAHFVGEDCKAVRHYLRNGFAFDVCQRLLF